MTGVATRVQTTQHAPIVMEATFVRVWKASLEMDSTAPVGTMVLLPPTNEVAGRLCFTDVCDSVHKGGGHAWLPGGCA